MTHAVNSDQFGYEYAEVQRSRARAFIALGKMQQKEIRKMVPSDFAPKNKPQIMMSESDKAKSLLVARCIKSLGADGPQTTAQIGHSLRVSCQAIAGALKDHGGVERDKVSERSKKTGYTQTVTLWMLPEHFTAKINQQHKVMKNECK